MKLLFVFAFFLMAYVRESVADDDFYNQSLCHVSISHAEVVTFLTEAKVEPNPQYRITYDLYTRKNINQSQILRTGDKNALSNSNFDSILPLRISIHGWTGRSTSCSNLLIKDAYLSTGDFNVILVDWSEAALNTDRSWVENQFPKVADEIAQFLNFLLNETGAVLRSTYLIGHDTGCHIAGMVGKLFKTKKLGAIIALDPPGLLSDQYLAPNHARYVQSIRTDISVMRQKANRISHAVFFPNWGNDQPQCKGLAADFECNHFAAVQYFAESVRKPKLFGALRCPSLSSITKYYNCKCSSGEDTCKADGYMGGEPLMLEEGYFYLSTESSPPYGFNDTVHVWQVEL